MAEMRQINPSRCVSESSSFVVCCWEKLTKVDQVGDGVKPSLAENQPSHNFVEVDAVVQGKLVSQAHVAEERHEVSKHKYETDYNIEQDGSPWGQRS